MADIELVIKIPEEMYKWVNDVNKFFDDYGISDFIDLVENGTSLPKGHGRLIDYDEMKKIAFDYGRYTETALSHIKPRVLIEADKAESEMIEKKLSWLGKNCKDCGNEKCRKLGTLPKGYDCALWQVESEDKE